MRVNCQEKQFMYFRHASLVASMFSIAFLSLLNLHTHILLRLIIYYSSTSEDSFNRLVLIYILTLPLFRSALSLLPTTLDNSGHFRRSFVHIHQP